MFSAVKGKFLRYCDNRILGNAKNYKCVSRGTIEKAFKEPMYFLKSLKEMSQGQSKNQAKVNTRP